MSTTVEFAVQMTCESCVNKIENSLKGVEGIKTYKINKEDGAVLVESTLPSSSIQEIIESSGRKAVLKGYGGDSGDKEEIPLEKVELDASGHCTNCSSAKKDDATSVKSNSEIVAEENTTDDAGEKKDNADGSKKKRTKNQSEFKSDDEEELELKYSSDSEDDDFENRLNMFNAGDGDDVWKIDEEAFDVIDADGGDDDMDVEKQEGESEGNDKSQTGRKRKLTGQSDDASGHESNDDQKSDTEKDDDSPRKISKILIEEKSIDKMKSSTVRKGDFNLKNSRIGFQILILPKEPEEVLKDEEAQIIKDSLCKILFKMGHQMRRHEPGAMHLRFTDCKFVKPGWLLVTCDDKETYDWLMSWEVPSVEEKHFHAVPALEKAPPQIIKFSLKSSWIETEEIMLKLIHLQNRDLDTTRWVLQEKKPSTNNMDQYKFQVDCGSVRALERINWTFFYELFSVKIIEHNGKTINAQMRAGK